MTFQRGDHVCAIYSSTAELVDTVTGFLQEGLRRRERCWYVAGVDELRPLTAALRDAGIDVDAETTRGALRLITADAAYTVQGGFNPEATIRVFNDAIEQAWNDGFSGFRAAAEMSWVLRSDEDAVHRLIAYEALLRTLFATCRATGLCLYQRHRMPLAVIDGALATHPIAGTYGQFVRNPFYDAATERLHDAEDSEVLSKPDRLDRPKSNPE